MQGDEVDMTLRRNSLAEASVGIVLAAMFAVAITGLVLIEPVDVSARHWIIASCCVGILAGFGGLIFGIVRAIESGSRS